MKHERWVVLPDLQYPLINTRTVNAVFKYIKDNRWDGLLQLGDLMDWDWCSRWTVENKRRQEKQRFQKEYEGANKFLDTLVEVARFKNKKAQMVILEGNHDYRVEVVMDKDPQYEGMLEMEKNLHFKERGIYYHRYWTHRKPFQIGNALFVHGEYINDNHAKKMSMTFDHPVYYGHTHDHQLYSRVMRGGDKTITAESLGCLCRYDLPYMGHKPSNWQNGFAIFEFFPDGYFNHTFIDIFKHRFVVPGGDGKIYAG